MMDRKVDLDILVQRARPRDLPGVVALRERNLMRYAEQGELPLSWSHETIWRRCADALSSPLARIEVALDGESVVGCLFLRLAENPLNSMSLIAFQEVFLVESAYRGRGLGEQLLARGEQWARDNGAEGVALVSHDGDASTEWFPAHGYQPCETFCMKRLE